MTSHAILLAGGSGSRMRGSVGDKVLAPLAGIPVLAHSVRSFLAAQVVRGFVIVCRDDAQQEAIHDALRPWLDGAVALRWARGGAERQDSVLNGLAACPGGTGLVFIHDGARPLIRVDALQALASTARRDGAAVLAHRVKDTIKQVPPGTVPATPVPQKDLERATLWAMETPQVFHHAPILAAYQKIAAEKIRITDDVAAATHAGMAVSLVENLHPNPKITEPHDLQLAEFLLSSKSHP